MYQVLCEYNYIFFYKYFCLDIFHIYTFFLFYASCNNNNMKNCIILIIHNISHRIEITFVSYNDSFALLLH